MTRIRRRDLAPPVKGEMYHKYAPVGSTTSTTEAPLGYEVCEDTNINPGGENPFDLIRAVVEPHVITLEPDDNPYSDSGTWVASNIAAMRDVFVQPRKDSLNNLGVEGTAKANPSQPAVSIPTFLGEMKDFPRLIKAAGDTWIRNFKKDAFKTSSEANLAFQFGLKPLVSDVGKLFNFMEEAQKSYDQWVKLANNGGTSRTRTVDSGGDEQVIERYPIYTNGPNIYARYTRITQYKTWVVTKWVPSVALSKAMQSGPQSKEFQDYVKRNAAGINSAGAMQTLWELTPWSFLADYFSNVGDYLQAIDNSVASRVGNIIVCHKTTTSHIFKLKDELPPRVQYSPGGSITYSKQRHVLDFVYPAATQPFLSKKKLGILASLSILQFRS